MVGQQWLSDDHLAKLAEDPKNVVYRFKEGSLPEGVQKQSALTTFEMVNLYRNTVDKLVRRMPDLLEENRMVKRLTIRGETLEAEKREEALRARMIPMIRAEIERVHCNPEGNPEHARVLLAHDYFDKYSQTFQKHVCMPCLDQQFLSKIYDMIMMKHEEETKKVPEKSEQEIMTYAIEACKREPYAHERAKIESGEIKKIPKYVFGLQK